MSERAIILLAHGSRDPLWRRPIEAVQARLQTLRPGIAVRCAYLELCPPSLEQVLQELADGDCTRIAIAPLFLGAGRHVREDLPQTVRALAQQFPQLRLSLAGHIGEDERVVALLAQMAAQALDSQDFIDD
ncbi:CbiX/SirB N-terminal domain-containing protein [Melaminivora jejuensis]|uniref:sirohydrochlorin chelatase n=1 Tax=Melaminivora jejuensis TaxID=1267217 RepID=UPI001ADF624B|nr:CbiX/SirB N-terminal domain-containing protein [Melaminivora jejuensis]UHJ66373.1 CbiX/SirB N-terminal domain-containing protein [Melaminivora jejuensis]